MALAVQKFCCCGSLRTGAITAAVLNALFIAGLFIVCFVSFINADHYARQGMDNTARDKRIEGVKTLVQAIVGTIVVVFLCLGIHKRKPTFIIPWLVFTILVIIAWIIYFIIIAIGSVVVHGHAEAQAILIVAGMILLGMISFTIYLLIVVYSFYQTLKDQPGQVIIRPVPMGDPVFIVTPASGPSPFYGPTDAKTPPPLYPRMLSDNEYPAHFYQKPPAYTSV